MGKFNHKIGYSSIEYVLAEWCIALSWLRFQCLFWQNCWHSLLGQIWSQNMMFSKLHCSKPVSILAFILSSFFLNFDIWENLFPKFEILQWTKFGTGVHFYILIMILAFAFSFFLTQVLLGKIFSKSESQNMKFSKLIRICYRGTLSYVGHGFDIVFQYLSSSKFLTLFFNIFLHPSFWR